MADDAAFDDLMTRLRRGEPDAAALVFHRYAQRLIALARGRLSGRLRQKVDPEDVLQSAYRSFFRRHAGGEIDVADWDSLWSLLTVITVRKCGKWADWFRAGKRALDAEAPAGDAAAWEALAREPTPPEAAMLTEAVERLLNGVEGRERAVVELALQGATVEEISARVGRTRRTVQRVLQRVKDDLQRQRDGDGPPPAG
jgi:RNA polymerase sigma-70 factor (ECF subfamily)